MWDGYGVRCRTPPQCDSKDLSGANAYVRSCGIDDVMKEAGSNHSFALGPVIGTKWGEDPPFDGQSPVLKNAYAAEMVF